MVDILHKVGIASTPDEIFAALTTVDGLSGWWTDDTAGDPAVGGTIHFTFGPGSIHTRVVDLQPGRRVLWEVVDEPEEWIDTEILFELRPEGDYTTVLFSHRGWKEPVEFMHHCSTKWATYLMSLKSLLETGKGAPAPRDVKIDSWD